MAHDKSVDAALKSLTRRGLAVTPDLPFGLEADHLLEPFCACGHVVSRCDHSRAACNPPTAPRQRGRKE